MSPGDKDTTATPGSSPSLGGIRVRRETMVIFDDNDNGNVNVTTTHDNAAAASTASTSATASATVTATATATATATLSPPMLSPAFTLQSGELMMDTHLRQLSRPKTFRKLSNSSSLISDIFNHPDVPEDQLRTKIKEANERDSEKELIDFLRNTTPPPENYMSIPDDPCYYALNSLQLPGDEKGRKKKSRRSSMWEFCKKLRRHSSSKRPRSNTTDTARSESRLLRLPDSAVAGRTIGGYRHIAISIPIEHAHLEPVLDPHAVHGTAPGESELDSRHSEPLTGRSRGGLRSVAETRESIDSDDHRPQPGPMPPLIPPMSNDTFASLLPGGTLEEATSNFEQTRSTTLPQLTPPRRDSGLPVVVRPKTADGSLLVGGAAQAVSRAAAPRLTGAPAKGSNSSLPSVSASSTSTTNNHLRYPMRRSSIAHTGKSSAMSDGGGSLMMTSVRPRGSQLAPTVSTDSSLGGALGGAGTWGGQGGSFSLSGSIATTGSSEPVLVDAMMARGYTPQIVLTGGRPSLEGGCEAVAGGVDGNSGSCSVVTVLPPKGVSTASPGIDEQKIEMSATIHVAPVLVSQASLHFTPVMTVADVKPSTPPIPLREDNSTTGTVLSSFSNTQPPVLWEGEYPGLDDNNINSDKMTYLQRILLTQRPDLAALLGADASATPGLTLQERQSIPRSELLRSQDDDELLSQRFEELRGRETVRNQRGMDSLLDRLDRLENSNDWWLHAMAPIIENVTQTYRSSSLGSSHRRFPSATRRTSRYYPALYDNESESDHENDRDDDDDGMPTLPSSGVSDVSMFVEDVSVLPGDDAEEEQEKVGLDNNLNINYGGSIRSASGGYRRRGRSTTTATTTTTKTANLGRFYELERRSRSLAAQKRSIDSFESSAPSTSATTTQAAVAAAASAEWGGRLAQRRLRGYSTGFPVNTGGVGVYRGLSLTSSSASPASSSSQARRSSSLHHNGNRHVHWGRGTGSIMGELHTQPSWEMRRDPRLMGTPSTSTSTSLGHGSDVAVDRLPSRHGESLLSTSIRGSDFYGPVSMNAGWRGTRPLREPQRQQSPSSSYRLDNGAYSSEEEEAGGDGFLFSSSIISGGSGTRSGRPNVQIPISIPFPSREQRSSRVTSLTTDLDVSLLDCGGHLTSLEEDEWDTLEPLMRDLIFRSPERRSQEDEDNPESGEMKMVQLSPEQLDHSGQDGDNSEKDMDGMKDKL